MPVKVLKTVFVIIFLLSTLSPLEAGMIDHEKRRRRQQRKVPQSVSVEDQWKRAINNLITSEPLAEVRQERLYDINRDGHLQAEELADFLWNLVGKVDDEGRILSDTGILKTLDRDGNGYIDVSEANFIKQTLSE